MLRPRRFLREHLADQLDEAVFEQLVAETEAFLERRFQTLAVEFDSIDKTNFNPFLLLITAPVYNTFSPFEVAERLQLAKAFHGDDTAFGKLAEDRFLQSFGCVRPLEKTAGAAAWEPIDVSFECEGQRYLVSVKSGPWTMNQAHANAMVDRFARIHEQTGANVMIGITYGRYENLNNKPMVVQRGLGDPEWFDYLIGGDFWEFISGVRDVHREIFRAIRTAQKRFAEKHKDETFHEKLVSNRLKIAASLRGQFNVDEDEDFWSTLFNNAF